MENSKLVLFDNVDLLGTSVYTDPFHYMSITEKSECLEGDWCRTYILKRTDYKRYQKNPQKYPGVHLANTGAVDLQPAVYRACIRLLQEELQESEVPVECCGEMRRPLCEFDALCPECDEVLIPPNLISRNDDVLTTVKATKKFLAKLALDNAILGKKNEAA